MSAGAKWEICTTCGGLYKHETTNNDVCLTCYEHSYLPKRILSLLVEAEKKLVEGNDTNYMQGDNDCDPFVHFEIDTWRDVAAAIELAKSYFSDRDRFIESSRRGL